MSELEFENQKQSYDWNLFLYNLCLKLFQNKPIILKEYQPEIFGSWVIEFTNITIVYEGRDNNLSLEIMDNHIWNTMSSFNQTDLSYSLLKEIVLNYTAQ